MKVASSIRRQDISLHIFAIFFRKDYLNFWILALNIWYVSHIFLQYCWQVHSFLISNHLAALGWCRSMLLANNSKLFSHSTYFLCYKLLKMFLSDAWHNLPWITLCTSFPWKLLYSKTHRSLLLRLHPYSPTSLLLKKLHSHLVDFSNSA